MRIYTVYCLAVYLSGLRGEVSMKLYGSWKVQIKLGNKNQYYVYKQK